MEKPALMRRVYLELHDQYIVANREPLARDTMTMKKTA
jgi:hypothetical protein